MPQLSMVIPNTDQNTSKWMVTIAAAAADGGAGNIIVVVAVAAGDAVVTDV